MRKDLDQKQRTLAIDLLKESALKWEPSKGECWLLVKQLIYKLYMESEGKEAKIVEKLFENMDDIYHTLLFRVAHYESPKLTSQTVKVEIEKRFVVVADTTPLDEDEMIEYAQQEQKRMLLARKNIEKAQHYTNSLGFNTEKDTG